jgi:hypothetical protein
MDLMKRLFQNVSTVGETRTVEVLTDYHQRKITSALKLKGLKEEILCLSHHWNCVLGATQKEL